MDKYPKNKFEIVNKLGILFLMICITPYYKIITQSFFHGVLPYYSFFLGNMEKT
jgi:hypothetical protein